MDGLTPLAERYRAKAAEFSALAETAPSPELRREHTAMAAAYLRLAVHADRNTKTEEF
jgi:hypothetical protein